MSKSNHNSNVNLDTLAEDFNQFYGYIYIILEDYCKSITDYFSWGFLRQESDVCTINQDIEEIELNSKSFACTSEDYRLFNADKHMNFYFPMKNYNGIVSFVCVKNKPSFLNDFNLDNPEDFYSEYPLLIEILRNGIEYCKNDWPNFKLSQDKSKSQIERTTSGLVYALSKFSGEGKNTFINSFNFDLVTKYLESKKLPHLSFFHSISDFNYEGNHNNGYIEFCGDSSAVTDPIRFSNNLSLGRIDSKFLRKILEMTEENYKLLVYKPEKEFLDFFRSEWNIIGLGINKSRAISTAHFMGASKWQLYSNTELISYDGKSFTAKIKNAPKDDTNLDIFFKFFKTIHSQEEAYDKFLDLYRKLVDQKHGTMVVICENAKQEAERLCNANRGIRIEPKDCSTLSKDKILQISKIDGAMLIDPNCICYALGVILDGFVEPTFKGDPGRGARYNSAKLYIHNIKSSMAMNVINIYTREYAKHAMAVVISEDGYIDVFSST